MINVDARGFENESYSQDPSRILGDYKKGAIQSIEFKAEGSEHWLSVFARSGKKVHFIDEDILRNVTVGVINKIGRAHV